jgi:hypothetical protein
VHEQVDRNVQDEKHGHFGPERELFPDEAIKKVYPILRRYKKICNISPVPVREPLKGSAEKNTYSSLCTEHRSHSAFLPNGSAGFTVGAEAL